MMIFNDVSNVIFLSHASTAAATIAILTIVYLLLKNRNILPGPTGLPYLGMWPFLQSDKCHLQLQELGKKYGDLFSFTYAGTLFVNLGTAKAVREAHVNNSEYFTGRTSRFNVLSYLLDEGVAVANGEAWKNLRKFFVQAFREYGMASLEDKMLGPLNDSLSGLIDDLHNFNNSSVNIFELLTERCMNTMQRMLFNEEGITREEIREIIKSFGTVLEGIIGTKQLLMGTFGRLVFRYVPSYKKPLSHHQTMVNILNKVVKRIESTFDENHPTCIIESFFKERNDRRRRNDPTAKYFTDKALVSSLSQFVGDGILSVAFFMGCFLQALLEHPEEQQKIYEEIIEVVGESREPALSDKSKMSYTNSFIYEVMRTCNFFPFFPSLECTKETYLRGYRIPKGAITLLNMWSSHHDPEVYAQPDKFDPSRYLKSPRPELPILFGIGKRACSGEAFVMMNTFLFLTTIIKHFNLTEPENSKNKSSAFILTGILEICARSRTEKR